MEIGKDASEMLVSERNAVLRGPAKAEITGGTEKRTARRGAAAGRAVSGRFPPKPVSRELTARAENDTI